MLKPVIILSIGMALTSCTQRETRDTAAPRAPEALASKKDVQGEIDRLQAELKRIEKLLPHQGAVMGQVGYQFNNLYFAIERKNWALAEFFLGEAGEGLDWAVRIKPTRKGPGGDTVDLAGIAKALQNTEFAQIKKGLRSKDAAAALSSYDDAIKTCNACHQACGKPLVIRRPISPEGSGIEFAPGPVQ